LTSSRCSFVRFPCAAGVMVSFIDFSGIYEKQGATLITEYATQSTEEQSF
jgi:hypothetical protein